MKKYGIESRFVHMRDALVYTGLYADNSLALVATETVEDGFVERETLSVNLSMYPDVRLPPEGHVWVRDYSEHEGLPQALVNAGIGTIVDEVTFGPFGATAKLLLINEDVRNPAS